MLRRLLRLLGAALLLVIGIRILDWLMMPATPLLLTLIMLALIAYFLVGRRSL